MEAQATLMMNLSSTINQSIATLATSLASGNNSPSSLKRKAEEILELTQMNEYLQPVTKKKSQMSGSILKTNANYVVSTEQATVNLAIVNGRDPTSELFTPALTQSFILVLILLLRYINFPPRLTWRLLQQVQLMQAPIYFILTPHRSIQDLQSLPGM